MINCSPFLSVKKENERRREMKREKNRLNVFLSWEGITISQLSSFLTCFLCLGSFWDITFTAYLASISATWNAKLTIKKLCSSFSVVKIIISHNLKDNLTHRANLYILCDLLAHYHLHIISSEHYSFNYTWPHEVIIAIGYWLSQTSCFNRKYVYKGKENWE